MDTGTVALLLLLAAALSRHRADTVTAATALDGGARGIFDYPDDEHVIITQYGPMRYEPATAGETNGPYDGGTAAGYYRAEVIPLDVKTWMPVPGTRDGRPDDFFDVPLMVGYTVRPVTTPARRRRRHDHYLTAGYPLPLQPPPSKNVHGLRQPPQPPAAALLWRY